MSICLQKSASIPPKTSPPKFGSTRNDEFISRTECLHAAAPHPQRVVVRERQEALEIVSRISDRH